MTVAQAGAPAVPVVSNVRLEQATWWIFRTRVWTISWDVAGESFQYKNGFRVELLRLESSSPDGKQHVERAASVGHSRRDKQLAARRREGSYGARVTPIRGDNASGASVNQTIAVELVRSTPDMSSRWFRYGIVLAAAVLLGVAAFASRDDKSWLFLGQPVPNPTALFVGLLVIVTWALILVVSGQLRKVFLVGVDNRTSTSKATALMWTAAVGFVIAYYGGLQMANLEQGCGADRKNSCTVANLLGEEGLPETYLLLLGAPFGALLAAQAITANRVQNGDVQRTENEDEARLSDIATNDANEVDLYDAQYLLFNVITFGYFIIEFAGAPKAGLPKLPLTLVALTGAGAATYVGNKLATNNRLQIVSLTPALPVADEKVTIRGRNFLPSGASWVDVQIGGQPVEPTSVSNTEIDVIVPINVKTDTSVEVQVTTQAGQSASISVSAADSFSVKALETTVQPGDVVTLAEPSGILWREGVRFYAGGEEALLEGNRVDPQQRSVRLAPDTPPGSVALEVKDPAGRLLGSTTITVEQPSLVPFPVWARRGGSVQLELPTTPTEPVTAAYGEEVPLTVEHTVGQRIVKVMLSQEVPVGPGTIAVSVGNKVVAHAAIEVVGTPAVTNVIPARAGTGTSVTVTGEYLATRSGAVQVTVSGVPIPVDGTPTRLIGNVPPGIAEAEVAVRDPIADELLWPQGS